jgi:hypothetical protein
MAIESSGRTIVKATTGKNIGLIVVILAATVGCNKPAPTPETVFQTASPENQARWQLATQAAKTNGYVTAVLTLRKLQLESALTKDQQTAVNTMMATVNVNLSAAEQAGDPEAKQATEEIRRRWRFP